jgi:cob(I)alamin adenosyltransferase
VTAGLLCALVIVWSGAVLLGRVVAGSDAACCSIPAIRTAVREAERRPTSPSVTSEVSSPMP